MPDDQRPYAVLDIDATLSDTSQRVHFLQKRPKDWGSFFAHAKDDAVLDEGLAVATTLAADHDIVYLSGRPERLRRDTVKWLEDNGFPEGKLLMRGNNDRRPSAVMKLARLRTLAQERRIAVLVDDDVKVCDAAEKAGYTVMRADWGLDAETQPTLFEAQESEGRT
ncbi:putative acid phosphatase of HAD superfamily subfamily IIIB [Kribbella orskensis]|uniref:Acid phosphatase of HAD superfamily subfamily IIIB n=1 Tax=Kribbella orskensis TaxID=2512216 RepID=A0ABY2B8C0_9ACTN|nr:MULTISPECIES: HAD family acid phosphatase [Kribbella]TCN31085.1 putative acid phosphatase of HAD superfamily subfamily IIIB [Kribbella sp. VKM Ac-2500]TCO11620.1 putative acid phosphatase of HAD superfamily subfamily IIIB [Kribbella orskensis]